MKYSRKKKQKPIKKEKVDLSQVEDCPRYRFLEELRVLCPTPDYKNFFWFYDDILLNDSRVVGIFTIDWLHNHQLGLEFSFKNTVHIRSLGVANDDRGIGYFSCLCSILISIAQRTGVFIHGVANPFRYDIPRIENQEEALKFLEDRDNNWYSEKLAKDYKEKSMDLQLQYVKNGFCSYDSSGYEFRNKFFKKTSFGFLGEGSDLMGKEDYFNAHLSC